jgi:hypothetical protein
MVSVTADQEDNDQPGTHLCVITEEHAQAAGERE